MSRIAPWAGWICGLLAWFLTQQGGSDLVQLNCTSASSPTMLLIGLAGGVIALAGALVSLQVWRSLSGSLDQPHAGARRFLAATGGLAAGIFLLAILFQTVSTLIIPQCHA